ncbi:MAG: nitrogen fixation protein FixH [Burkholderiaceae bacterium]|jgi:hypothetical protein|nr:nitrogen fixation protein FixH [Burkholderiaceae bacterium]
MNAHTEETFAQQQQQPWWRYGHVWLVIAGPLMVVLASIVTIYLAVTRPDPVYQDAPRPSAGAAVTGGGADARGNNSSQSALTPAMLARNHAATGGVPPAPEPKATPSR